MLGVAIMLLISPLGTHGAVYSPPWADALSFAYGSGAPGAGFNTTNAGNFAFQNLRDTGYKAWDTRNVGAGTAMSFAKSDAIWAFFGHGRAGAVMFYNGTSYSELVANSEITTGYTKVNLNSYSWTDLHDVRLMVFAACNTARDGKAGSLDDGNISRVAYIRKGVDSTLAFLELIYWPHIDVWGDAFFNRLRRTDDTINQAAVWAADMVEFKYFSTGGFDSWWTIGGSKKIKPVGYGT